MTDVPVRRSEFEQRQQRARLIRFFAVYGIVTALLGLVCLALMLTEPSGWIALIFLTAVIHLVVVWWATGRVHRGDEQTAVLVVNVSVGALTIAGALVAPKSHVTTAMSCVPPVLVAFTVLPRRRCRQLIGGAVAYCFVIALISRTTDVTRITDRVSSAELYLSFTAVVPGLVALIGMIGWHNHRVLAERASALAESRRRLLRVAEHEQQQVEKEIRDGAQRCVADAVGLLDRARYSMATSANGPASVADVERDLADAARLVETAIADLRRVVTWLRPAVLAEHGLSLTLPSSLRRMTPAGMHDPEIRLDGLGRYPDAIEGAVWFGCVEAITALRRLAPRETPLLHVSQRGDSLQFRAALAIPSGASEIDALVVQSIDDRLAALDGYARTLAEDERVAIEGVVPIPPG